MTPGGFRKIKIANPLRLAWGSKRIRTARGRPDPFFHTKSRRGKRRGGSSVTAIRCRWVLRHRRPATNPIMSHCARKNRRRTSSDSRRAPGRDSVVAGASDVMWRCIQDIKFKMMLIRSENGGHDLYCRQRQAPDIVRFHEKI